jgi:hypothetical protein
VTLSGYADGIADFPPQTVGPDELLVFATAAAYEIPLLGPAPTDPETLDLLAEVGINFASLPELIALHAG